MITIPTEPVGYGTSSMVVVICPTCSRKAWAIISKKGAQTVCCSAPVDTGKKAPESPTKLAHVVIAPAVKRAKHDKDKKRKDQGRRGR